MAKPMGRTAKVTKDQNLAIQKKCWELRVAGKFLDQIAQELGISRAQAHRHVEKCRKALSEDIKEIGKREIQLELQRLDFFTQELIDKAANNPTRLAGLASAFAKISERRAKILGYDSPVKTELSGPDQQPITLQTANWQEKLLQAGWTPPDGLKEILPGLPVPNQLPENSDNIRTINIEDT